MGDHNPTPTDNPRPAPGPTPQPGASDGKHGGVASGGAGKHKKPDPNADPKKK